MKKNNFNPALLFGVVFGGFGLIFFIIGLCIFTAGVANQFKGEETTAVITAIERYPRSDEETDYDVYVEYEYDGEIYSNIPLNYYSSSMREGKKIKIKIDPEKPDKVLVSGFNMLFGGVFGGVGLIFAVIGAAFLVTNIKGRTLAKRLVEEGYFIEAQIDCIDTANIRINGRPTYLIRCNYRNPDDGKIYSFKSEPLMFDPTPLIDGNSLRVYVDKNDYTKNYVDISEFKDKYIEC